jgi:hypothetical protein
MVPPRAWPLAALALALAGCDSALPAVDPARAREALQSVLEAWRRGESPDSLRQQSPPVHVGDDDWKAGRAKLVRYEVADPPSPVGAGLRFRTTLTLQDARGKSRRQTVQYRVFTAPCLSVVREYD